MCVAFHPMKTWPNEYWTSDTRSKMMGDRIGNYSDQQEAKEEDKCFRSGKLDFVYVKSLSTKTHCFKVYNHKFALEAYTRHHAHSP